MIAGGLFLVIRIRAIEKQRLVEQRLEKIAEMNHHIRNALQVVSSYAEQVGELNAIRQINESVRRIEWAVSEILPRGWNLDTSPAARPHPFLPSAENGDLAK